MITDDFQLDLMHFCRGCGKIVEPELWHSIQITKHIFWWFCSTDCMKYKKFDAQVESINLSLDMYDWDH